MSCDWLTPKVTCVPVESVCRDSGARLGTMNVECYIPSEGHRWRCKTRRGHGLCAFTRRIAYDPHKIGLLGFSQAGYGAAMKVLHFKQRVYPAVDARQRNCRGFCVAVFIQAYLWSTIKIRVESIFLTHKHRPTPPRFCWPAEYDYEQLLNQSLVDYIALKDATVPVEMHIERHGGHPCWAAAARNFPITGCLSLV